ncbi:16S rRNA (adenine(1518)-N(6)/adenine(1519)-N(6))-dimethyltransferase RsmA [Spirochaetia bacterium 38H-sp]|uniref:Ribosomal RNA small subunit methyltransferase A n=1 Tax=Rarispira pelagica TaxID=3141764 RepID=A0ABU9UCV2_9SPIR
MEFEKIDYNSPASVSSFLESYGFSMQKRFGQNFLVSSVFRHRIADVIEVSPDMRVWEIGPGIGSLTSLLIDKIDDLCVFEIDRGFVKILSSLFPSCRIIEGDFLKTWMGEFNRGMPDFIVGNLPYNVGTVIVLELLKNACIVPSVFMFQKEVARRFVADRGDEFYGALSLVMSFFYERIFCFDVPASAFWPRPRVVSSVVKLVPKEVLPVSSSEIGCFVRFVFELFSYRRKSLRNVLKALPYFKTASEVDSFLDDVGLDGSLRAEVIEPDVFLNMWKLLGA